MVPSITNIPTTTPMLSKFLVGNSNMNQSILIGKIPNAFTRIFFIEPKTFTKGNANANMLFISIIKD